MSVPIDADLLIPGRGEVRRSWIDALVGWGTSRRTPWWVLIGTFWILGVLSISAIKWWDGSLEVGQVYERTVDTFYGVAGLVAYGFLNQTARRSFDTFRPALEIADDEAHRYRDRLSTLSPRAAVLSGVAGAALSLAALLWDETAVDLLTTSVASTIVVGFFTYLASGVVVSSLLVHIMRQLRLVTRLHRLAVHITLFRPEPAHAFSRLTAVGGGVALVLTAYSILTDPATLTNPVWVTISVAATVLAMAVFLLPLRGMQVRLQAEKRSLLDRSAMRIEAASADLHRLVDGASYASVAEVRWVLVALDEDQRRIKTASTWPWETSTLRGFTTALLAPIAIWFLTRVLGKTFGF
jgi:hypothetical protein